MSRLRRIRRWAIRGLAALAILLVTGRIALPYLLPVLVGDIAPGFRLEWDDLDLSLLGGSVKMRHVQLGETDENGDLDPKRTLVELEYVNLEISTLALLTFDLEIGRVELDGADVHLRRNAEGAWNFDRLLAGDGEESEEPEEPSDPNAALPKSLGFELFAGRVQHVRVDVVDETVSPALETWLDTTIRISHLGQDGREGRASLTILGEHLDVFRIDSRWQTPPEGLTIQTQVALEGLRPGGLETWLEPLGVHNDARTSIEFGVDMTTRLQRPDGEEPGPVQLGVQLTNGGVWVDRNEIAGFDRIAVDISDLLLSGGLVEQVVVEHPRARVRIDQNGELALGSLRLGAAPDDGGTEPVEAAPAASTTSAPSRWAVGKVEVRNAEFDFEDRTTTPVTEVRARTFDLAWSGLEDGRDTDLRIGGSLPGIAESISVNGKATVVEPEFWFGFDVALAGLTFRNVEPWLQGSGIRCRLQGAELDFGVRSTIRTEDDKVTGSFALTGLRFADASTEESEALFRLDEVSADGIEIGDAGTSLGRLLVQGLRTEASVDADGILSAVGFEFSGAPSPESRVADSGAPQARAPESRAADPTAGTSDDAERPIVTEPAQPAEATSIRLERLDLRDLSFGWTDHSVAPEVVLDELTIGGHIDDLVLSPTEGRGSWQIELASAGKLFDAFEVTGDVVQDTENRTLSAQWSSTGMRLDAIQGYLVAAGLESTFEDGRLGGRLNWTQTLEDGSADIDLSELVLQDGDRELLRSPTIRVVSLTDTGIGRVVLQGFRTEVHRLADGRIEACGIRTLLPDATAPEATAPKPADQTGQGPASGGRDDESPAPVEEPAAASSPFGIGVVRIEDFAIAVRDDAVEPALQTEATIRMVVNDILDGIPASVEARVSIPELLEAIELDARLEERGDRIAAEFAVLHPTEKVAAYLPPNLELMDAKVSLRGKLAAELGDPAIEVRLEDLRLESPSAPRPWFEVPKATVRGAFGPTAATDIVIEVESVRAIARRADGSIEAAGLRILDEPRATATTNAEPEAVSSADQPGPGEDEPATEPAPAPAPAPSASNAAAPLRVHLERLAIEVADFEWTDRRMANPAPLRTSLNVGTQAPFRLGFDSRSDDAGGSQDSPLDLFVEVESPQIVDRFRIESRVDLSRLEPEIDVKWELDGIDGPALLVAVPDLAETIDASGLTDGKVRGKLHLTLHAERDPSGMPDLDHEFGFDLQLEDVSLATTPDAEPAVSIADFEIIARQILPNGAVLLDSIDLSGFRATAEQTPSGLKFAGITMLAPKKAAEAGANAGAPTTSGQDAAANEATDVDAEPAKESPPFQLDRLSVQDTSFRFADSTGEKRVELPIDQIELDVQGIRLPATDSPVRFSAYLQAGDTELPIPEPQESLFGGILSTATNLVTGGRDLGTEVRPLFETVSATGQMTLAEEPTGRIRVDVSDFELLSLKPFAAPAKIDIRSGRFTNRTNIDLRGEDGIDVSSRLVFKELGLTDEGGTISEFLGLGAPISTVLYALRNSSGEQVIPLSFKLDSSGGVSTRQITTAATTALASVLTDAITSAGFRVAAPITDLLPFGGPEQREPLDPIDIHFSAGSIDWLDASSADLDRVAAFLRDNDDTVLVLEHELSAADQERAERLANPDERRLRNVVSRMRERRVVLRNERLRLIPETRRLYGSGRLEEAEEARTSIHELDQEIGQIEAALDELLRLLRPGAERRTDRRTRTAATVIATQRLGRIEAALLDRLGPSFADRIDAKSGRGAVVEGLELGTVRILRRYRAGG